MDGVLAKERVQKPISKSYNLEKDKPYSLLNKIVVVCDGFHIISTHGSGSEIDELNDLLPGDDLYIPINNTV